MEQIEDDAKDKGGRPTIALTKAQIAEVKTLAAVLSQEQIADYFKIGRTTWYEILKRQPEVAEQYKIGKARAIAGVAQGLIKRALAGDTASTIFYLKTQGGWKETSGIDHTSTDGSMSPKGLAGFYAAIEKEDSEQADD